MSKIVGVRVLRAHHLKKTALLLLGFRATARTLSLGAGIDVSVSVLDSLFMAPADSARRLPSGIELAACPAETGFQFGHSRSACTGRKLLHLKWDIFRWSCSFTKKKPARQMLAGG